MNFLYKFQLVLTVKNKYLIEIRAYNSKIKRRCYHFTTHKFTPFLVLILGSGQISGQLAI